MGQVTVRINGRTYVLACNEGEEAHLRELARYLDRTVSELTTSFGQIGEPRLLVMAALTVSDRLSDALGRIEEMQRELIGLRRSGAEADGASSDAEEVAIRELDGLAQRLENLAKGLTAAS